MSRNRNQPDGRYLGHRRYDWNSYHFFPDVHNVDHEGLGQSKRPYYQSYGGHRVNLDWLDVYGDMYDRTGVER